MTIEEWLIAKVGKTGLYIVGGVFVMAVVGLLLTLAYCAGGAGQREQADKGTIKIQAEAAQADGNAADARVADVVKIQNQQREIEDAVQNTSTVDDARRARGCVILRQQGRGAAAKAAGC